MRRSQYAIALLCAWGVLFATVLAPAASATWGHKCSAGNTHHCYGIANWSMTGSGNGGGEEVKGISGEINTFAMQVPVRCWQYLQYLYLSRHSRRQRMGARIHRGRPGNKWDLVRAFRHERNGRMRRDIRQICDAD